MSLLDTLKAKLDPELFAQVTDSLGDDFDYDLVSRQRLNTVIGQREAANRALARLQTQNGSSTPGNTAAWNGEGESPMDTFAKFMQQMWATQNPQQQQQQQLQEPGNAAMLPGAQIPTDTQIQARVDAEVQKQVNQVKQQYAITEKLREANVVDPSLVLNAGLLDASKFTWDKDDPAKLTGGLEEQLQALKESRAYLFQTSQPGAAPGITGTGREGAPGSVGSVTSYQDFVKLPYQQQLSFKAEHPEAFQGFMQAAGIAGLMGEGV